MKPKAKILEYLEIVAPFLPTPIYWENKDSVLLGANQLALDGVEVDSPDQYVGKTPEQVYPKDMADNIKRHNEEVMRECKILSQEETIKSVRSSQIKHYLAIKAPLFDDNGDVIGIVGTSIEITAQKEAERLKVLNDKLMFENQRLEFENNAKQISVELDAYKKFKNIADQMAHDIGSPLMALSVLENSCAELPEGKRHMLRESIASIREIAGSLLSQYKPQEEGIEIDNSSEILVYAAIEQIILEKQHEYHHLPIKFISEYENDSQFSFAKGNVTSFKRMLSNLINNSVHAVDGKFGNIFIKLVNESQQIKITITDNGTGMSHDIVEKIMNNRPVTFNKSNGRGIGFSQIHETLQFMNGKLFINSIFNEGTAITLTIPAVSAPEWMAGAISINSDDSIIVLDDDNSIHGAWNIRFEEIFKTNPKIQVRHFTKAIDTTDYIASLSEIEKQRIFLLTDYELLKQNLNGLDVIAKTQVKRSILVTSHYNNLKIRQQASFSNTGILPKLLASFITIKVVAN